MGIKLANVTYSHVEGLFQSFIPISIFEEIIKEVNYYNVYELVKVMCFLKSL